MGGFGSLSSLMPFEQQYDAGFPSGALPMAHQGAMLLQQPIMQAQPPASPGPAAQAQTGAHAFISSGCDSSDAHPATAAMLQGAWRQPGPGAATSMGLEASQLPAAATGSQWQQPPQPQWQQPLPQAHLLAQSQPLQLPQHEALAAQSAQAPAWATPQQLPPSCYEGSRCMAAPRPSQGYQAPPLAPLLAPSPHAGPAMEDAPASPQRDGSPYSMGRDMPDHTAAAGRGIETAAGVGSTPCAVSRADVSTVGAMQVEDDSGGRGERGASPGGAASRRIGGVPHEGQLLAARRQQLEQLEAEAAARQQQRVLQQQPSLSVAATEEGRPSDGDDDARLQTGMGDDQGGRSVGGVGAAQRVLGLQLVMQGLVEST